MIRLTLEGRPQEARAVAAPAASAAVATLPAVKITELAGRTLSKEDLAGRVVLVEFWATWCPPCRGTLGWLGELQKRYGDRVVVVALSVESEEADVKKVLADVGAPLRWAMATPEIARSFGDVSAVPTLLLFDAQGQAAGAFYGAPPTLHAEAEKKIEALVR
jgi:thiol-disulfide isomerase/thioredoxin